jgi:hypothetical protein
MRKLIGLCLMCALLGFGGSSVFAERPSSAAILVINAPSAASFGSDFILAFGFKGRSAVLLGAEHNLGGLSDIVVACAPKGPASVMVSHSDFSAKAFGFLILNVPNHITYAIPSGSHGGGSIPLAIDHASNLYVVESDTSGNRTIFKNHSLLATIPSLGDGTLAVDSRGNLYLSDSLLPQSQVFRIDPGGNVTVFADATHGLQSPIGLAIESKDNLFVANNPPSAPAFILKFDSLGTPSPFAAGISFQPIIRGLTVDHDDYLYATLEHDNTILKFDRAGHSRVFADANDGLIFPGAITVGTCPRPHKKRN